MLFSLNFIKSFNHINKFYEPSQNSYDHFQLQLLQAFRPSLQIHPQTILMILLITTLRLHHHLRLFTYSLFSAFLIVKPVF